MVKVEERTPKERDLEELARKLLDITSKSFPGKEIGSSLFPYSISIFNGNFTLPVITTRVIEKRVNVALSPYFDRAIQLAETYEAFTGPNPEWTVKKDYD